MVSQNYNPKKSTAFLVTGPGGLLKPALEEAAKEWPRWIYRLAVLPNKTLIFQMTTCWPSFPSYPTKGRLARERLWAALLLSCKDYTRRITPEDYLC